MKWVSICLIAAVVLGYGLMQAATVESTNPAMQGPRRPAGVDAITWTFTSRDFTLDVNSITVVSEEVWGLVRRIVAVGDTDPNLVFNLRLLDSDGLIIHEVNDVNIVDGPNNVTHLNPLVAVGGPLTLTIWDVNEIKREIQTLSPDAAATAGGWQLIYDGAATPDVNAVYHLYMTSGIHEPNDGTFKLTLRGEETAAIDYDASAADVVTALNGLTGVSSGDIVGSGGPLPGATVVLTAAVSLAWQDLGDLTISDNSLAAVDVNSDPIPGADPNVFTWCARRGRGLPYDANIAEVQAALESLATVNVGDIVVGGGPLSEDSNDMTFLFAAHLGDVSAIEVNTIGMVGPTVPFTVTETAKGQQFGILRIRVYLDRSGN